MTLVLLLVDKEMVIVGMLKAQDPPMTTGSRVPNHVCNREFYTRNKEQRVNHLSLLHLQKQKYPARWKLWKHKLEIKIKIKIC